MKVFSQLITAVMVLSAAINRRSATVSRSSQTEKKSQPLYQNILVYSLERNQANVHFWVLRLFQVLFVLLICTSGKISGSFRPRTMLPTDVKDHTDHDGFLSFLVESNRVLKNKTFPCHLISTFTFQLTLYKLLKRWFGVNFGVNNS